jgi:SAM-dependent methyltransferase
MAELTETDIREQVRERYAAAATAVATKSSSGCCGGEAGCGPGGAFSEPDMKLTDRTGTEVFGGGLYDAEGDAAPRAAVEASLGCGVPTAVADLHEGETVLDLGSGAGADVLISARRVGASGKAIGLDMTDEMLELARANAAEAGIDNVEFVKGYIEEIPLEAGTVDVVISNCVINLAADKRKVLAEVARVLRPGGRFAVSDVIADPDMDEATRADMQQWTGCVAGALTRQQFEQALAGAGLTDIEIRETHRVHKHASSAIVRARKAEEGPAPKGPARQRLGRTAAFLDRLEELLTGPIGIRERPRATGRSSSNEAVSVVWRSRGGSARIPGCRIRAEWPFRR